MATTSLFQPSIPAYESVAVYSLRASFFTAFFGGPVAAILIHGLNVGYFGRWQRDHLVFAAALIASIALMASLGALATRPDLLMTLPAELPPRQFLQYLRRLLGLVVWAALYWRLREPYRAARLNGDDRPAWRAGIACTLIGGLVSAVVVVVTSKLVGKP